MPPWREVNSPQTSSLNGSNRSAPSGPEPNPYTSFRRFHLWLLTFFSFGEHAYDYFFRTETNVP